MKKLVFIFCFVSLSTLAQDEEREYKNEFGLDVTSFIQFYTTFGDAQSYYYPNYYLSYRRYFDKSNLRAAIGADIFQDDVTTPKHSRAVHLKADDFPFPHVWDGNGTLN